MTRTELAPPVDTYGEAQSIKNLKQLLETKATREPAIETINDMLNREPLSDDKLAYAHILGFESQTGTEGRGRI